MEKELASIESLLFSYLDELKFLFFPEKWTGVFLDYSKNEVFTMLFLYRHTFVTMTEIAEYMQAPLNTATGVVNRLETRMVVSRQRNEIDKRVVTVSLTDQGKSFIQSELKEVLFYYKKFMNELSEEEKQYGCMLIDKAIRVLKSGNVEIEQQKQQVKKVRKIEIE